MSVPILPEPGAPHPTDARGGYHPVLGGLVHLVLTRRSQSNGGTTQGVRDVGAVRMLAGFEIRRRWRRVVVLTLLVGVVGAVVLSTVAGARRSESALARFNASSRAANLELTVGDATPSQLREFRAVAGVESFARLRGDAMVFPHAPQLQAIAAAVDTRFGTVVDRARIVAGRAADPTAVDEVTIGEALAAQLHLGVGDHLDGESYTPEQVASFLTWRVRRAGPGGSTLSVTDRRDRPAATRLG